MGTVSELWPFRSRGLARGVIMRQYREDDPCACRAVGQFAPPDHRPIGEFTATAHQVLFHLVDAHRTAMRVVDV